MESILRSDTKPTCRIFSVLRDLPSVLDTESAYPNGWTEEQVIQFYEDRTSLVKVWTLPHRDYVIGHCWLTIFKKIVSCHGIRVKPGFRRQGVGSAIVRECQIAASRAYRHTLLIPVHEADLDTQLFLKSRGILCTRIVKDRYVFEWSKK